MGAGSESQDTALNMGAQMSGVGENPCPCCTLSFKQRLYGFAGCFAFGMLLSFLSTMQLWSGNYQAFGALYSIGNLTALLSTGFLMGASFFIFVRRGAGMQAAPRAAAARRAPPVYPPRFTRPPATPAPTRRPKDAVRQHVPREAPHRH